MIIRRSPPDPPGESGVVVLLSRPQPEPRLVRAPRTGPSLRAVTDLSSLGASSCGVWNRRQALRLASAGRVDALVRAGSWQVLWRGVYCDGGYDPTPEQRAVAAVLAVGGDRTAAVASGRTAARAWGLPLIDDADPATGAQEHLLDDVAVRGHLPRQAYAGRLLVPHQPVLRPGDAVRLPSGLLLTSPLRTLVDCSLLLAPDALVCAADRALHQHLLTRDDLTAAAAARHGTRGAPALTRAGELADPRAESPPETLARLLLRPVLPDLEPQVELVDEAARLVARFDLGDRRARLAVEADGKRGHAGSAMVAKDRRRDRGSDARGWATERVTWFELRREQDAFVRRVLHRHHEQLVRHGHPVPRR